MWLGEEGGELVSSLRDVDVLKNIRYQNIFYFQQNPFDDYRSSTRLLMHKHFYQKFFARRSFCFKLDWTRDETVMKRTLKSHNSIISFLFLLPSLLNDHRGIKNAHPNNFQRQCNHCYVHSSLLGLQDESNKE